MPIERVAFVGLGNMGAPMARNLIAAGFHTTVTDLDAAKMSTLVTAGATAASSIISAVGEVDVVFTSLPGPTQVRAVAVEILPAMQSGAVWVDLSTNDLACARLIQSMAVERGVALLDAPVSGGAEGATAGTLTVMVGGDEPTFTRCHPLFEAIGERIEHLGPHGAGYVAKIAQVMLCYLNSVCLTEALVLGAKGGVEPAKMLEIIRNSTGRSYVADQYGPEILNGRYDDTFDLGLAAKDLRLTMELAHMVGAKLDFTQAVSDLYASAEASFGFSAPHLMALQTIERHNEMLLSETITQEDVEQ